MVATGRLLLLLLLAAGLSAFGGTALAGGVAVAGLTLVAAGADWWLGGRDAARLAVRREVADKLSLGAWSEVALLTGNETGRGVRLLLRDQPPPDFRVETDTARGSRRWWWRGYWHTPSDDQMVEGARPAPGPEWWRGWSSRTGGGGSVPLFGARAARGGESRVTYRVYPRHRGSHAFGDLYLRLEGPLGLVGRARRVVDSGGEVRVYPNLRELRKYDLMARRGAMIEAGTRAVRVPGASTEFERLREYGRNDEFRRINWKATARRGKPIVNQLEAERSQNLVIMVDAGRHMAARAAAPVDDEAEVLAAAEVDLGLTKLDHALNSALMLAYVASLRGDRVALLVYADEVRAFLPPARGRRAFVAMVQTLYKVAAEAVEPDHGAAFQFLASRNLRRSLVVLFTDVADRESSAILVSRVLHAARHHQVVCVTLGDPTVSGPAAAVPRSTGMLYERMVAQRLLDERATVLATLAQRGVLSLDTDADRLSPRLIRTYLELKQRARV